MRRTGLLIGGWALATVLALVLGLQSVSAISDSVTSRPRKTLSPASVRAALDRSDSSDSSSSSEANESTTAPNESSSSSGTSNSSSSRASSASSSDDGASSQSSSDDDGGGLPSSSSGDNESRGEGSSSSAPTAPAPHDETYELIGGTVAVRFENGAAHLLFATAAAGFTMENNSDSSTVDVRFRNDDHESRVKAFWNDGPQHEIEEKD